MTSIVNTEAHNSTSLVSAFKCMHYEQRPCKSTFEQCKTERTCKSYENTCYASWNVTSGDKFIPTSAGCLQQNVYFNCNQNCQAKQTNASKKVSFFCCCNTSLCNQQLEIIKEIVDIVEPSNSDSNLGNSNNLPYSKSDLSYEETLHPQQRDDNLDNLSSSQSAQAASIVISLLLIAALTAIIIFLFVKIKKRKPLTEADIELAERALQLARNPDSTNYVYTERCDVVIDLSRLKFIEKIGAGRFGTVHKAIYDESLEFAVKVSPAQEHESWSNEKSIYESLSNSARHTNLLLYYGALEQKSELGQVLNYLLAVEYAPNGCLHEFLSKNTIEWNQLIDISLGIAKGLDCLHNSLPKIAHRDFKSKNILLKNDLMPCIADFSLAAIFDSAGFSNCSKQKLLQRGTFRYMAPEILECSVSYTGDCFTKADVYALALVLWELLSRCQPLPTLEHEDTSAMTIKNSISKQSYNDAQNSCIKQSNSSQSLKEVKSKETSNETISSSSQNEQIDEVKKFDVFDYKLPFEDEVGLTPDMESMFALVVTQQKRPSFRKQWERATKTSKFCEIIKEAWSQNSESRISASCVVDRLKMFATSA